MASRIRWIPGAAWRQEVVLDGRVYTLRAQWNTRHQYWSLDIQTGDRDPILSGLKLTPNWEIIGRYADERLPPGRLFVVDTTGRVEKIGRQDMGRAVELVYAPL